MDQGFMEIALALITLLGAIVTYILVPYFKSQTTAQQQQNILFWVSLAVNAAEQIFTDPKSGPLKKSYVIKFLDQKGIKLTEDQLDVLIEAVVREMNLGS